MTPAPKQARHIGIKTREEPTARVTLEDGTTLEIRTVVSAVRKIADAFDQFGNPVYQVSSHTFFEVVETIEDRAGEGGDVEH